MDDFAGDSTTTGFFSLRDNFDSPLVAEHQFEGDSDWFRVDTFRKYFDYRISTFLVNPDDPPIYARDVGLYDLNSVLLWERGSVTPAGHKYQHFGTSGDHFVGVTALGNRFSTYRLYIRTEDLAGESESTAAEMRFEERPFQSSAIESLGDRDWFAYKLREGVNYSIDLLGESSFGERQTTLANPVLRIFDSAGQLVAEDDDSGAGTDAQVNFTPSETGTYYLESSSKNGKTGSYILESEQFDDYLNNVNTTGHIVVGEGPVSGRSDHRFDNDWFQIELEDYYVYQISSPSFFSLYDANGDYLARGDKKPGTTEYVLRHRKNLLQPYNFFIGIVSDVDYQIEAQIVDDRSSGIFGGEQWSFQNESLPGTIETGGDHDWFRLNLVAYARYFFDVQPLGQKPLDKPAMSLRADDGTLLINGGLNSFTYDTGQFSQQSKQFFADVRSNDIQATGIYEVSIKAVDKAGDDTNTRWNVQLVNGKGRIRNAIEVAGDRDFHRIAMKENTWYRFDRTGLAEYQVIHPSGHVYSVNPNDYSSKYYYANQAGDYYIAFRSAQFTGYELKIAEGATPPVRSSNYSWPDNHLQNGMDFYTRFNGPNVELYSDTALYYFDESGTRMEIPAEQLTMLTLEQWKTVQPIDEIQTVGEVFVRNQHVNGSWLTWTSFQLDAQPFPEEIATESPSYSVREYAFADGLPSYLAGNPDYTDFAPLTMYEQNAMNGVMTDWSRNNFSSKFIEVSPGVGNDAAVTMIFKAAIDSDVWAFAVGEDEGGDIVLNTNSPLWADLGRGKQGLFEMVRAVGTVLGLSETTEMGRHQSVMGARSGADFDSLPFASTPLPLDIRGVRNRTDNQLHRGGTPGNSVYDLTGPEPFYQTIIDGTLLENNVISAQGLMLHARIDLRAGQVSFAETTNTERPYSFVNSFYSSLHEAIGGEINDALIGNHLDNRLEGRGGNDVLTGGIGRDMLLGGPGNDYYIYKFGHGADMIDEFSKGGFDVLRVEGMHNLTSLTDDFTFERFGNDLIVRLELDGQEDREGQQITIKNMGDAQSKVEALALFNPAGFITRINLQSAFEQSTSERQRFKLTSLAGEGGWLVAPV